MPVTDEEFGVISEELVSVNLPKDVYNDLKVFKERADARAAGFILPDFPGCMDSTMPSAYRRVGGEGVCILYYEAGFRGQNTMGGWVSEYVGCEPERRWPSVEMGFKPTNQGRSYRLPGIGFGERPRGRTGRKLDRIGFALKS